MYTTLAKMQTGWPRLEVTGTLDWTDWEVQEPTMPTRPMSFMSGGDG